MSWRGLLEPASPEVITYPWTGGRELRAFGGRTWRIEGELPREHGWYGFRVRGRVARLEYDDPVAECMPDAPERYTSGYLAADRFIPDGASANEALRLETTERVHLIPAGVDRFTRVRVARHFEGGPLIWAGFEFPLGPESEVYGAFLERRESVRGIPGVTPAIDVAFRLESWRRAETERARAEIERRRAEEEARARADELRREVLDRYGDAAQRRALARVDFAAAATAALAVGGAEYLDSRYGVSPREMIVRFRLDGERFECTCHEHTLQIIDSGICLRAERDSHEWDAGTRGDTWLTLESLPPTIRQAEREGVLVVFRHT